jgi:type II secretory pathway component PulJ
VLQVHPNYKRAAGHVPNTSIQAAAMSALMAPWPNQRGESLVGLLVGMGVGLVVLAAGARLLATHLQAHRWLLQDSHLHHDLRSALDTVASALRQAQFVGQAAFERSASPCADAFCGGQARLMLQAQRIDFGRDRNGNGLLDNNECTGFRLRAQKLQVRTACLPEVWTDLTDAGSLKILNLQWQLHCEAHGPWVARWVTVDMLAQWPQDPARQLQLSHTVALRNHVPASPWPPDCGPAP